MRKYSLVIFQLVLVSLVITGCGTTSKEGTLSNDLYKDPNAPLNDRVESLLAQMTLEEKLMQVQCFWQDKRKIYDSDGEFNIDSADKYLKNGLGQIGRPSERKTPAENAKVTNTIQKYFIEQTRLGIPVLFHEECLHGHAAKDATSFSQPIGLASTWNTELVESLFDMTAREARSRGTHLALTPVVDVAREPRWGRVEETYGEDPYLVSQMGLSAVKGFQGGQRDTAVDGQHILACLKHFVAHGQPESGNNISPVNVSKRILREQFLYPFEVCVKEGGVSSIMASYNEVDGVPSHGSNWLLNEVLRKEWGFKGVVVSDYYAIEELHRRHKVAEDYKASAVLALKSGVDIELPDPYSYPYLKEAIEEGELDESVLDQAVKRILRHKFALGLFENPYIDESLAEKTVGTEENAKLALQAAEETMVLLKNEENLAPLNISDLKSIAVIGPNADRELLGGYSDHPKYFKTVLEGIRNKVGDKLTVRYAEGCKVTKDSVMDGDNLVAASWYNDPVELESAENNASRIAEAVRVAKQSDVVILCIGGNELTSREGWAESHLGDRTDLKMVGQQNELVEKLAATGKPIIALVFNGKPLAITELTEQVPTIFECWYMGQETGDAVADVIFGDVSPSGRLPISIPRSVGHIPCYYNYKPTARRGYLFDDVSALYTFGYGLSYTAFEYSDLALSKSEIKKGETTELSVTVKNTGEVASKEVVQVYIRDEISSVTRPVKELKAFKKIYLEPGEEKKVSFKIGEDELAFWDIDMEYTAEPGEFTIMVGTPTYSAPEKDDGLKTIKLYLTK